MSEIPVTRPKSRRITLSLNGSRLLTLTPEALQLFRIAVDEAASVPEEFCWKVTLESADVLELALSTVPSDSARPFLRRYDPLPF